jgi:hypothetical protein
MGFIIGQITPDPALKSKISACGAENDLITHMLSVMRDTGRFGIFLRSFLRQVSNTGPMRIYLLDKAGRPILAVPAAMIDFSCR